MAAVVEAPRVLWRLLPLRRMEPCQVILESESPEWMRHPRVEPEDDRGDNGYEPNSASDPF